MGLSMNLRQLTGTGLPTHALDRAPAARSAPAAPSAAQLPAASVQVSDSVAGNLATAALLSGSTASDAQLISTLKARIAVGEFKIEYGSLARLMVEDAMQAMDKRR